MIFIHNLVRALSIKVFLEDVDVVEFTNETDKFYAWCEVTIESGIVDRCFFSGVQKHFLRERIAGFLLETNGFLVKGAGGQGANGGCSAHGKPGTAVWLSTWFAGLGRSCILRSLLVVLAISGGCLRTLL